MKQYFLALATFSGTIIGVGLFGLPYVTLKAGVIPVLFYFALITLVMTISHLVFGEICLRTEKQQRLPGYTETYLGKKYKFIPVISNSVGLFGANLAYTIIGGGFLANLFIPIFGGNELAYFLVFFASGAFIIYIGSRAIAKSELLSIVIFLIVFTFIFIKGFPYVRMDNFNLFNGSFSNLFLPYGVILFSLSGMSVIPEAREILGKNGKLLKNIIIVGTLVPAVIYLLFIFLILGASGQSTTQDALTGLRAVLGPNILIFGFIFGIITTFTSYISIGLTLKKIFWYDLKFDHFESWVIATFMPVILYFIGLKDFIKIISFTGAVTMGIDMTLVYLIHLKAKTIGKKSPEYKMNIPMPAVYILILLFLIGVTAEIIF
jgi:tyrosine-specific transport protein